MSPTAALSSKDFLAGDGFGELISFGYLNQLSFHQKYEIPQKHCNPKDLYIFFGIKLLK